MDIEFEMNENTLVIRLSGEIDHHTCVEVREKIDREYQKKRAKNMLFDFENIQFMDSSGIGLLMTRYRNVAICGGSIALYNISPKVDKLLEISGIYKLMKPYADKDHALKSLV